MKVPFIPKDLKDKVVVITGAAGVICGGLADAITQCGAKVALLDRNLEKAQEVAKTFTDKGYVAKAYVCNVLDKESLQAARDAVTKDFGTCDILINGAGGNNPRATTANEFADFESVEGDFFSLEKEGVEFVFG
ncbi:MAG: SDR family NAD(P)-dependent oxidoreductase, partial [Clostridia bacterium]|nr:SDR family NAD(P)-dependent oxidoreductase [Clostridia bacterium]